MEKRQKVAAALGWQERDQQWRPVRWSLLAAWKTAVKSKHFLKIFSIKFTLAPLLVTCPEAGESGVEVANGMLLMASCVDTNSFDTGRGLKTAAFG